MTTAILGGGLAGLSLAGFLKGGSLVLEAENAIGGLCRSFDFNGVSADIGPHILFSKNQGALDTLLSAAPTNRLKRSNKIFHKGRFIKYPFENELSSLSPQERDYCLNSFLNNKSRDIRPGNMLEFYLKTFGEGIVKLYLEPYNRKIWKFDPAQMDMQMVERIPRPPDEDILKSAQGAATEGYLHQLYFHYPVSGGIQSVVAGFAGRLAGKAKIETGAVIQKIAKTRDGWEIATNRGVIRCGRIINCMPLHELFKYIDAPADVLAALDNLKYNSIHIISLKARKDAAGDNFALNFADPGLVFHRLSKLNFLGENYRPADGSSVFTAEVTFRRGDASADLRAEELPGLAGDGLAAAGIVAKRDIQAAEVRTFKYAYVIYNLAHRRRADFVLSYLRESGIDCCGRFAEFEYLNMDAVIDRSRKLAARLNG